MSLFVRKLRHGAALTPADEAVLENLGQRPKSVAAGHDVVSEGEEPHTLPLIAQGWACRYRLLENGKRQVMALYIPGDLTEPFGTLPHLTAHPIMALTAVKFMPIGLEAIQDACRTSRRIEQALWWDLLVSSASEREHIVSVGRRTAIERMAHLFCELYHRSNMVGGVEAGGFILPMTQAELGEVLGLSTVHVNRSLQELRRSGLVAMREHRLIIEKLHSLQELALFEPTYLHLDGVVIARDGRERSAG